MRNVPGCVAVIVIVIASACSPRLPWALEQCSDLGGEQKCTVVAAFDEQGHCEQYALVWRSSCTWTKTEVKCVDVPRPAPKWVASCIER